MEMPRISPNIGEFSQSPQQESSTSKGHNYLKRSNPDNACQHDQLVHFLYF